MDSTDRKELVRAFAAREAGASIDDIYDAARANGDTSSKEAYYNIVRRLEEQGQITSNKEGRRTIYHLSDLAGRWLDEDDIERIINPDYPLVALSILREAHRQVSEIPEAMLVQLRQALAEVNARAAFKSAIAHHCQRMLSACEAIELARAGELDESPAQLEKQVEEIYFLLRDVGRYALGLSREALMLPNSPAGCIKAFRQRAPALSLLCDESLLSEEIDKRVADEPLVVTIDPSDFPVANLNVLGIDGSTRGGLLYGSGEVSDFTLTTAPSVTVNTSVAYTQKFTVRTASGEQNVLFRLPEKPEDMQREDNRFTIMAKAFYPDLTESKYMHSVWNAMDLLEARVSRKVLRPWFIPGTNKQIPEADVVMRDGTLVPNERDSSHYAQGDTYGVITRDLIRENWELARAVKDGHASSVVGVVKQAQVRAYGPVIAHVMQHLLPRDRGVWPVQSLSRLPDATLLSRLLLAGRREDDPWFRTAVLLRPFHAACDRPELYSRTAVPSGNFRKRGERALAQRDLEEPSEFWATYVPERDPYTKMLDQVAYAHFFLAAVPRMDDVQVLPRFEILIPTDGWIEEEKFPADLVAKHLGRTLSAVHQDGFDVAKEHSMFDNDAKLDVLPTSLVAAHERVKSWANDLIIRAQEFVGLAVADFLGVRGRHKPRVKPMSRAELQVLANQMQQQREEVMGAPPRA